MGTRIYYTQYLKKQSAIVMDADEKDTSLSIIDNDDEEQPLLPSKDPFDQLLEKAETNNASYLCAQVAVYGGDKYMLCSPTEDTSRASRVYKIAPKTILKLFKEETIRTVPGHKADLSWLTISAAVGLIAGGFWMGFEKYITHEPQMAMAILGLTAPTYYILEVLRYYDNYGQIPKGSDHQQIVTNVGKVTLKVFADVIGWMSGLKAAKYLNLNKYFAPIAVGIGGAVGAMAADVATSRASKELLTVQLKQAAEALEIKFDPNTFDVQKLLQLDPKQLEKLLSNAKNHHLDNSEFEKNCWKLVKSAFETGTPTLGFRAFTASAAWYIVAESVPKTGVFTWLKPTINMAAVGTSFFASGLAVEKITETVVNKPMQLDY